MEDNLWLLFSSSFLSSTILPGSSEVLLLWFLEQESHSPWVLLVIATTGNSLGSYLTWGMGYLIRKGYQIPILRKRENAIDSRSLNLIERYGSLALLLAWLPIIGDGVCLASGYLRHPIWISCLLIFVGKIVRYSSIVYFYI